MKMKASGSCLCGAVAFEVKGPFDAFFLCHCGRCQKDTGSAHAANLFSPSAKLVWLNGEDRVTTFQLPETRHQKSFCATCGSALPFVQENGALLVVPAGSLDTDVPIKPIAHICCADRATWDNGLEVAPRLDGLPV